MIVEVTVGCNIDSPQIEQLLGYCSFFTSYIYDYLLHRSFILMSVNLVQYFVTFVAIENGM